MTRDKTFKRRVRQRMTKTGERYATARAQLRPSEPSADREAAEPLSPSSPYAAGAHPETSGLRCLLAAAGIELSEPMLLGIGGGIGAAYFVFEYEGHAPMFYIGTRCGHQYPYTSEFSTAVLDRLGVAHRVVETGAARTAANQLRAALAGGPVLAWVDLASLPYEQMPAAWKGSAPHVVVVSELGDERATVHDRSVRPFSVSPAELAAARSAHRKSRHRLVHLEPGAQPSATVADAALAGIRGCLEWLAGKTEYRAVKGNFGLAALEKWARLVDDVRDKKGWPKVFGRGQALYRGLTSGYRWIEVAGTGGGGFRGMYAAFLREAAALTGRAALDRVARDYEALGDAWTELARAMLPGPVLGQTRTLLDQRAAAFRARGPDAADDIRAIDQALKSLEQSAEAEFPLSPADVGALHADLGARLRALVAQEKSAASALADAI